MKDKTLKELKEIARDQMKLEFSSKIKKNELLELMGYKEEPREREINSIFLHCSASDMAAHDDISVIRKWHVDERGWTDVGYHYFIKRNGTVQKGRPLSKAGAHTKGYNENSIGICIHGNTKFTADSLNSLESLLKSLLNKFPSIIEIKGHWEVNENKTCPNYSIKRFKNLLDG